MKRYILLIYLTIISSQALPQSINGLVAFYPFNGNYNDESGNNLHLTKYGSPTLTTDRFGNTNSAYDFNGITDYFYHARNNLLLLGPSFTLNAWIFISASDGDVILGTLDIPDIGGYQLALGSANELAFAIRPNSGSNDFTTSYSGYFGKWNMVTSIFTTTQQKIFINGILVKTQNVNTTVEYGGTNNFRIGTNPHALNASRMFKGKIDDIRIYNRALSDIDINQLFIELPFIDNTPTSVVSGLPVNINARPNNSVSVNGVVLGYRSVTNSSNIKTIMLTKVGQDWTTSIPASEIGELGIEYRLAIANPVGPFNQSPIKLIRVKHPYLGIPYLSYGTSAANYRMISIPLDLEATSANEIFGDELSPYDKFKWRLFQHKSLTTELNGSSTLKAGEGYWLIAKDNPGYPLTSGQGLTVNASIDYPFNINLQAGWNQIGNPYNFNLSWNDILTANTFLKDNNAQLRVYDGTPNYPVSPVLFKGEGGFVRVPSATTMVFPVTKNKEVNSGRINQEVYRNENPIDADNWEVMISLRQGDKLNTYSGIGMQPDASLSFDKYDGFTMPRFIEFLELNHDKTHLKDHFAKDIVPTTPEHTWSFEVASSDNNEPASLNWNNELLGDNEKELFLADEQEGVSINMRTVNSYSFSHPRRFKIIYGNSEYLSKEMPEGVPKIVSVNPNPSRGELKLLVSLPGWNKMQPIKIDVINLQGQAVAPVYNGSLISGSHELIWNGLNKEGERPAQGVYLLRMVHAKGQSVFRMVLVTD